MYYRKNGNIIREQLKEVQNNHSQKENYTDVKGSSDVSDSAISTSCTTFPMWALIIIIIALVILGICLIWWIWKN